MLLVALSHRVQVWEQEILDVDVEILGERVDMEHGLIRIHRIFIVDVSHAAQIRVIGALFGGGARPAIGGHVEERVEIEFVSGEQNGVAEFPRGNRARE